MDEQSPRVVIGMDPHKRSVTIEVMTADESVVGGGRFGTDVDGYTRLLGYARQWPHRVWAVNRARLYRPPRCRWEQPPSGCWPARLWWEAVEASARWASTLRARRGRPIRRMLMRDAAGVEPESAAQPDDARALPS
jgi:hypothetical protein